MNINNIKLLLLTLTINVLCISNTANAQDRMSDIKKSLDLLKATNAQLDQEIDVSVSDISIHEFLRGVAQSTGLNISVDNSLNFKVANSFKGVVVYDLILFLCRQYKLDLKVQGSIIHITKHNEPEKINNQSPKDQKISYTQSDKLLTIDVDDMLVSDLTKNITIKTGINIIPDKMVRNEKVSGYVNNLPVEDAIKTFFKANELEILKSSSNAWLVNNGQTEDNNSIKKANRKSNKSIDFSAFKGNVEGYIEIEDQEEPLITIAAHEAPVSGLISYVSDSLKIDYALVGEIDEKITVSMFSQTYDEFVNKLLKGTKYGCKKDDGVYYFSSQEDKTFNFDTRVTLANRTIENIMSNIPEALREGVEIIEIPELNSLFLSGEKYNVDRLKRFIKDIDQVIPVILIEVIIVDVNKTKTVSTGISAGFGTNPQPASQTLMSGVDYQFSTKQLNSIFQKFESFGWVNLGKVNPDFYFAIKALEENGLLNVRSTPKLSTLNGSKATLSSGETKYYKEEQSNYYGSQNPALTNSYSWKPIDADMSVTILPVVSGDDQVTLEIEVQQSEFTAREFEDSPPGSVSRNFKSVIRVKNQEMVLLGGLDRISSQNTGRGIPLLARIPIVKWLFSSKTKATTNSKLSVFIQPTILN